MTGFLAKIYGILIVLGLASCAQDDLNVLAKKKGTPAFQNLLSRGRTPAHVTTEPSRSLGLVDGLFVNALADAGSKRPAFVAIDQSQTAIVAKDNLASFALNFIAGQSKTFGLGAGDLRPAPNFIIVEAGGNHVLTFDRLFQGVPVDGGMIQVVFAPAGAGFILREIINRSYGDIEISADQKLTRLDRDLTSQTGIQLRELANEPLIFVQKGSDGLYQYQLAKRLQMQDDVTGEYYTVTVNNQGDILEAFSHIQTVNHTFSATVYERSYVLNKNIDVPLSFATINNVVVGKDGVADITAGGAIPVLLDGTNARARVVDTDANNQTARFNIQTVANTDKTLYPITPATIAAVNAYAGVNTIVDFVSKYVTAAQVPFLASKLTVTVNINDVCNAYYTNSTLNFFDAGASGNLNCANTANISDVIYHEWGHGFDDFAGTRRGITDGAFSEGIGDITAGFFAHDFVMAPGFVVNSKDGIRSLKNTKKYPDSLVNEVHEDGEIIGGAFWDMRVALYERYGDKAGGDLANKLFFQHLLTTDAYTNSYAAVVRLDDDDNDATTRSPNYCLITTAFAGHGLTTAPEPNCVDAVLAFDDSLKMAIRTDNNQGIITVWASAVGAQGVALCLGTRTDCAKTSRKDVVFTKVRTTTENVDIYKADDKLSIVDGSILTMFSLDTAGNIKGAREVKFTALKFD